MGQQGEVPGIHAKHKVLAADSRAWDKYLFA
jgi:hypothetical protein